MKTIMTVLLLSSLTLNVSMAKEKDHFSPIDISILAVAIPMDIAIAYAIGAVTSAYAPEASALYGVTVLGTGVFSTALLSYNGHSLKKQVQNMVNNDVQDFHLTGKISPSLFETLNSLQEEYSNLSDAEAIDLIVAAVN